MNLPKIKKIFVGPKKRMITIDSSKLYLANKIIKKSSTIECNFNNKKTALSQTPFSIQIHSSALIILHFADSDAFVIHKKKY